MPVVRRAENGIPCWNSDHCVGELKNCLSEAGGCFPVSALMSPEIDRAFLILQRPRSEP